MNATAAALPFAEIDTLRVGMFVHLELGWMAHPFPLSSFRISSAEQIETIRTLGLARVRWCPQRSAPAADGEAQPPAATVRPIAKPSVRQSTTSAAAAQRAALHQCERQFAEAARDWRQATSRVTTEPERAGNQTRSLTGAIVGKMLGAREIDIRLLDDAAADRASAHAINVAVIALLMGRNFGLGGDELNDLGVGALLHDIGKIDLPERLRSHDDDSWSPAERERWRGHVAAGVEHGRRMALAPGALLVIAQHHEQADGSGFPLQANLDRMSAASRIVSLVNRFDEMCNPAQPARALTPHETLSLMFAQSRHQFDTTMLSAFIRMMGVYPPGSAVQLTDDRFGLVVSVNSTKPLKPRLLLHDPAAPDDEAPFLDLETTSGLGIRRALKPAQLPRAALRQLAPRTRVVYGFEPVLGRDRDG